MVQFDATSSAPMATAVQPIAANAAPLNQVAVRSSARSGNEITNVKAAMPMIEPNPKHAT